MHIPCKNLTIGLDDPQGDISFLSHAHSDHTKGIKKQKRIMASKETIELAQLEPEEILDTHPDTKMIDAGHILGSRQLVVEEDGAKTVYTGDFSVKPNIFGWKADIEECDKLIMEATYGSSEYRFPPLEDIYAQIARWAEKNNKESKNIIIGSYELGKAQQLIKIVNEIGIAPIVMEKTERFCSVYEKFGVPLDRIEIGTQEAEEIMKKPFVAIVPMHRAKRYFAARLAEAFERETVCAAATGWALHYRLNVDEAFPLSDHADFDELVYYVEQTGAKEVEFFCGDGAKVLEKLGIKNSKKEINSIERKELEKIEIKV
ncbi:hypothetical protein HZC07_01355 [Candidatus Micrarchaeota archaeon]|nr:hypothetical protein [Candidatus Micrarchaeota archaeon]